MRTELSDFHKMVVTVLKTAFLESKPRVISYRDYRSFNNDKFKTDLKNSWLEMCNLIWCLKKSFLMFYKTCPNLTESEERKSCTIM